MAEPKLIPGFRFHPTDVELVMYFLKRKIMGRKFPFDVIAELDIYKYAPWDLPGLDFGLDTLRLVEYCSTFVFFFSMRFCLLFVFSDKSLLKSGDLKWYFFSPTGKKYSVGGRMNRATEIGFWKTTGKDRSIQHNNQVVGMIRTLVFHIGKAPKGDRTDWVMHEFRLDDKYQADKGIPQVNIFNRVYQLVVDCIVG
jgi:hypothetical protein